MIHPRLLASAIATLLVAANSHGEVSFVREIAPILARKCLACHNEEKAKGGYKTISHESLFKPGKSKAASITPMNPGESELYRRLASTDPDDRMPQKDEPLSAEQIKLFHDWIMEGARFDGGGELATPKASIGVYLPQVSQPAPEHYPAPLPILSIAFDGDDIATGGYHEITVWNQHSGKLRQRIPVGLQRVYSMVGIHVDFFACAGGEPGLSGGALLGAGEGAQQKTVLKSGDVLLALAIDPAKKTLACGGSDNAIHLVDIESGRERATIQQHADWVTCVRFSPDGERIVSASRDRSARVFSARDGSLEATYADHEAPVFAAAFSDDGKRVFSAGRDRSIHIWNSADGSKQGQIGQFEGDVYQLIVNGEAIYSCSGDRQVRKYSASGKNLVRAYEGLAEAPYCIALNADKTALAAGCFDGKVLVWNEADGKIASQFKAVP